MQKNDQESPGIPFEQTPQSLEYIPQQPEQPIQELGPEFELTKENIPQPQEQEETVDSAIHSLKKKLRRQKKAKPTSIPIVRDKLTLEVEHIMEEGLKEAFTSLSPIERQEFKIKGEQTAIQIRQLLKKTHVKVKSIFKLLFEWLKLLPGVNRFFLEQEAKIKTEKILGLHEKHKAMNKF
ncbi:hypothetical protein KKG22_01030 [Patescibacteria group bacterium]|nr:hypothetical protein [Patescibacteria group bacterium]